MIEAIPLDALPMIGLAGLFGLFGGSSTKVTSSQDIIVDVISSPQIGVSVDVAPPDLRPIADAQIAVGNTLARAQRDVGNTLAGALGFQASAQREVGNTLAGALELQAQSNVIEAGVAAASSEAQTDAIRQAARDLALAAVGALLIFALAGRRA